MMGCSLDSRRRSLERGGSCDFDSGRKFLTRQVLELDNCVAGIRIMRVPEAPPERMPLALSSTLRNR